MSKIYDYLIILWHDIYFGICKRKIYFIIEAIFLVLCASFFVYSIKSCIITNNEVTHQVGFIDFWLDLFNGIVPYDKNISKAFSIPITWLVFNFLLAVSVGFYAENDLSKNAIQIVLRMKSKLKWWVGKCLWCFLFVFSYYFIYNIIILIVCLLNNHAMVFTNNYICENILELSTTGVGNFDLLYISIIVPFVISVAISMFQMALSLYIKPIYSCLVVLCYTAICVYYNNKFLLFNYSMVKRNYAFLPNGGVNPIFGLVIAFLLIITSIVCGYIKLKHKDII